MSVTSELTRLKKRLERERKARLEAEAITEKSIRELYERQEELELLQLIAVAANESSTTEEAIRVAVNKVCVHTGWPVGHAYMLGRDSDELIPTSIWNSESAQQFETFRKITEITHFTPGVGLPGRIFVSGKPEWIVDVTKDSNFPRAKQAQDIGVRAGFGLPVLVGSEVVAVLEFFSTDALEPDERLLEVMSHVGTQLGRVVERKRAEETLRESEERFRTIFENSQLGIYRTTPDGRILMANPRLVQILGYSSFDELTSRNLEEEGFETTSKRSQFKKLIKREGEIKGLESTWKRQDGAVIFVRENARAALGDDGAVLYYEGTVEDITENKKLESQLLRAQRMESVGTLAGGIAHDLNNLFTPIMMALQILRQRLPDEKSRNLIDTVETSAKRGSSLVNQVLSFARGIKGERTVLQVRHLVSEVVKIAKETFPKSVEIQTDVPEDLWAINGDPTHLHQILMNLCVNARDAMSNGGILSITAENLSIDESYAQTSIDAKVGPYIVITVSDNGTGIPPAILDRIFEPFFTTKKADEGTGLGLSTAFGIVKSHGGFINVYSELGRGTKFKVHLPAVETPDKRKTEDKQVELPMGHEELVLVVDDEVSIRKIAKAILETCCYRAITANDGVEAVALYKQNKEEIRVVVVDMMMPVMDGRSVIRELNRINPGVKIIAASGLKEQYNLAEETGAEISAFLSKPYTAETLLQTLHETLNANTDTV
ncbi:MAG: ATP-binding protein [Deltaproteobacteria bacterium]